MLGALLAATGCATPSVHPIYSSDDKAVADPGLVGTWKQSDGKETYTVTRAGDGYHMLVKDNDGQDARQWEFSLRLVKIGDTNFADVAAVEEERRAHDDRWGPLFVPTHMFASWSLDKDTLTVRMLKREWLEKAAAERKVSLEHTRLDDHTLLITAGTKELQAFLGEYARNESAFADVVKLERQKK